MKKLAIGMFTLLALAGATGCTAFNGVGPSGTPQNVYVVGAKSGFPASKGAIWLCPTHGAECKPVDVEEQ